MNQSSNENQPADIKKTAFKLPNKLPVRILILLMGLFCIAFGVALSTKSALGVAPSAAIPYVLCQVTPLSMGFITTIVNVIMVLLQVVLLRKNFQPIQLLQLVVVFVFGYFTDWTLALLDFVSIESYIFKLIFTLIGCALMGLGVFLEVEAGLITLSSDGLTSTIVNIFHIDFGITKNIIDGSQVVIAAICSLIFLHSFFGMREGTVITAIMVGVFVQLYNKYFAFIHRWLNAEKSEYDLAAIAGLSPEMEAMIDSPKEDLQKMAANPSAYPLIITVEREYGSGGHEIGKRIADALGIPFYDYELIQKAALASGLSEELITQNEEGLPDGMIQSLFKNTFRASKNIRYQDEIFKVQSRVIRDIANKGESCVIVGRLSNHVLNPRPNCFNLFVSADYEYRARYLQKEYGYDKSTALHLVKKEDVARASYCKHFTGSPWGLSRHFTMTIDSSVYGITTATKLVLEAIDAWKEKTNYK